MNTFYKLFLLAIAIVCITISFTRADTIINWFTFVTPTDTIEILPEELPKTWAEEWNGDCSSYWASSYWKEWTCYTSKWARTFSKTITNTTDTKHVCTLDDNRLNNIINKLKQVQLEYSKMDVVCIDIIKVENEIKDLVNQMFLSRNKTTTNSKTVETAKWIPFPAPTVKYVKQVWQIKTVTVKVCWVWIYDKTLDACITPITGAR